MARKGFMQVEMVRDCYINHVHVPKGTVIEVPGDQGKKLVLFQRGFDVDNPPDPNSRLRTGRRRERNMGVEIVKEAPPSDTELERKRKAVEWAEEQELLAQQKAADEAAKGAKGAKGRGKKR